MQLKIVRSCMALLFGALTCASTTQKEISIRGNDLAGVEFVNLRLNGIIPGAGAIQIELNRVARSSVINVLTKRNGIKYGQMRIETKKYPEFDIYSMTPLYFGKVFLLEFKFGQFRDCNSNDDGRDLLYIVFEKSRTYTRVSRSTCSDTQK